MKTAPFCFSGKLRQLSGPANRLLQKGNIKGKSNRALSLDTFRLAFHAFQEDFLIFGGTTVPEFTEGQEPEV